MLRTGRAGATAVRPHAPAYFRQSYGVDVCDSSLYHLMLDSTAIELETCVEVIARAAEALRLGAVARSVNGPPR